MSVCLLHAARHHVYAYIEIYTHIYGYTYTWRREDRYTGALLGGSYVRSTNKWIKREGKERKEPKKNLKDG